ncbi:hypothetical protein [Methylobacter luteus]|uniref:hypothetical protein n=1 Tax=Methylobacter luteus TaxID=415 RepID=UPI00041B3E03|nr:hypothetical protein [Methylobacter luteus]
MSSETDISDHQLGAKASIEQQILLKVWRGIVGQIQNFVESGAFAQSFSKCFLDGNANTNEKTLGGIGGC